jgi:hypothetical protein
VFVGVVNVFVGIQDVSVVVHPAAAVGGGIEFHFLGEGIDILVLAAEK